MGIHPSKRLFGLVGKTAWMAKHFLLLTLFAGPAAFKEIQNRQRRRMKYVT
jgi:hypothetical protein